MQLRLLRKLAETRYIPAVFARVARLIFFTFFCNETKYCIDQSMKQFQQSYYHGGGLNAGHRPPPRQEQSNYHGRGLNAADHHRRRPPPRERTSESAISTFKHDLYYRPSLTFDPSSNASITELIGKLFLPSISVHLLNLTSELAYVIFQGRLGSQRILNWNRGFECILLACGVEIR